MRINDIINEASASLRVPPGDPILNDPNLYKLLEHYVGDLFMEWAIQSSPYNPSGRNLFQQAQAAAIKPIYNKIAAAIIPLAAQENPDINRILRIVDSQLSMIGGIPQDIKARVAQQLAADAKTGWVWREKSPAPAAPMQAAEPAAAPDTVQVAKWTVPDER
jgi:hypothetical protein